MNVNRPPIYKKHVRNGIENVLICKEDEPKNDPSEVERTRYRTADWNVQNATILPESNSDHQPRRSNSKNLVDNNDGVGRVQSTNASSGRYFVCTSTPPPLTVKARVEHLTWLSNTAKREPNSTNVFANQRRVPARPYRQTPSSNPPSDATVFPESKTATMRSRPSLVRKTNNIGGGSHELTVKTTANDDKLLALTPMANGVTQSSQSPAMSAFAPIPYGSHPLALQPSVLSPQAQQQTVFPALHPASSANPIAPSTPSDTQTPERNHLDEHLDRSQSPRFVRKRAYTSFRQTSEFSPLGHSHGLSPTLVMGPVHSAVARTTSWSPCQLLPAVPSPVVAVATGPEPRVTHLPRHRRSATFNAGGESVPGASGSDGLLDSSLQSTGGRSRLKEIFGRNDGQKSDEITMQRTNGHRRPTALRRQPVMKSQPPLLLPASEPSTALPRHASFDRDDSVSTPSTSTVTTTKTKPTVSLVNSDLFRRAGEAYQLLDSAERQLTDAFAARRHGYSADVSKSEHSVDVFPPRETPDWAATVAMTLADVNSGSLKENFRLQQSSTHTTCASNPPVLSSDNYNSNNSLFPVTLNRLLFPPHPISAATPKTLSRRTQQQLRQFCAGLRPHQSENVVQCDVSGCFVSRRCLGKIFTLDGLNWESSRSWKMYFMCISGCEVRFVKASSAHCSTGRHPKTAAKQDTSDGVGNLRGDLPNLMTHMSLEGGDDKDGSSRAEGLPSREPVGNHQHPPIGRSTSCLTLPISGLSWHPISLPSDLPSSWLTNPEDQQQAGVEEGRPVRSAATLQCYRFRHCLVGSELLFVFPDRSTATTCLKLCEAPNDMMGPLLDGSSRPVVDVNRLVGSSSEEGQLSAHTTADSLRLMQQRRRPRLFMPSEKPVKSGSLGTAPPIRKASTNSASTESMADDVFATTESAATGDRQQQATAARILVSNKTAPSSNSIGSRAATPFLRGIRQWLNRPSIGASSTFFSVSASSLSAASAPKSGSIDRRLAAIFDNPPDFSEYENSGPIFGAPLETQIESPDFRSVPVLLHSFVVALDAHGLAIPGLYRKPGRHRAIAQFVCTVNLVPFNLDLLLKLDAWREPHALCGLMKLFLRRLPVGLLNVGDWEPLTILVPEQEITATAPAEADVPDGNHHPFADQLAFLLMSVRVKLRRILMEAVHGEDPVTAAKTTPASVWRWSTLQFLATHIRSVVSQRHLNEVSYQCVAICFGPTFFDNSPHVTKLNVVLEHMFRHWHWLTDGLSTTLTSDGGRVTDPTLPEAIDYVVSSLREDAAGLRPESNDGGSANQVPGSSLEQSEVNANVCESVRSLLERAFESSGISIATPSATSTTFPPTKDECPRKGSLFLPLKSNSSSEAKHWFQKYRRRGASSRSIDQSCGPITTTIGHSLETNERQVSTQSSGGGGGDLAMDGISRVRRSRRTAPPRSWSLPEK